MLPPQSTSLGARDNTLIESVLEKYRQAISQDPDTAIETFLNEAPPDLRSALLTVLLSEELNIRRARGEQPQPDEYHQRFPSDEDTIARCFSDSTPNSMPNQARDDDLEATVPFEGVPRLDRYELLAKLGTGGFGEVWSARDPLLNRRVAIKILRRDKIFPASVINGLLQEGRKLSQLDHEGIVRVLDAGVVSGQLFLVSELMEGGSLEDRLRAGRIPRDQAVRWMVELARSLHHAHLRGFVHRDVKPANVLFDAEGRVHLADFGVALSEDDQMSKSPGAIGTLAYMSPEQARGESHLADPRSDVYSLGAVLYRLLTARLPFAADDWNTYREQVLTWLPRPLRAIDDSIPSGLEAICLKCLDPEPSRRYATALEVAEQLETQSGMQHTVGIPERKWGRRAVVSGLLGLGALGVWTLRPRNPQLAAVPGVPVEPAVPPLSWQHPEEVAWNPSSTEAAYGYDRDKRRYRVEASNRALFKVGELSPQAMRLSIDFSLLKGTGAGGVFWSLTLAADGKYHCWAVLASPFADAKAASAAVYEFTIAHAGGGRRAVNHATNWKRWPLTVSPGERAVMEVEFTPQELTHISINEVSVLTEPYVLPEVGWVGAGPAGYGFAAQMSTLSIYSFSQG